MRIISIKENPEYKEVAISYFQEKWASEKNMMIYDDCITHCLTSSTPLPQWYLLEKENEIIGCAGLITNDFISRMDLYPWICAIYIEEQHRGNSYSTLLLKKAEEDAKSFGYNNLYLSTDHIGFYEKYGYKFIGFGYHPWGESSRIYERSLK